MSDDQAQKPLRRSDHPDPVDIHVGARLRLRRNLLGMSQEQLGKICGLTFQQIQKYERGTNRLAASRLYHFSRILKVPVSYFFEDFPEAPSPDPRRMGMSDNEQAAFEGPPQEDRDMLQRRDALELIRAYYRITDTKQRRKIYELVKTMADS